MIIPTAVDLSVEFRMDCEDEGFEEEYVYSDDDSAYSDDDKGAEDIFYISILWKTREDYRFLLVSLAIRYV